MESQAAGRGGKEGGREGGRERGSKSEKGMLRSAEREILTQLASENLRSLGSFLISLLSRVPVEPNAWVGRSDRKEGPIVAKPGVVTDVVRGRMVARPLVAAKC